MTIKLADGTFLNPLNAIASTQYVQGANRDTIQFVFPESEGLLKLDELFTSENCETIVIVGETSTYVHTGYVIKAYVKKELVHIDNETSDYRVMVGMSQRTYIEDRLDDVESESSIMKQELIDLQANFDDTTAELLFEISMLELS